MKYEPTSHDTVKYLQFYNEIPEYKPWITGMIEDSHEVLVIGSDVDHLINRIKDPLAFWYTSTKPVLYNVFIIAVKVIEEDVGGCGMLIQIRSPVNTALKEPVSWKRLVLGSNSRIGSLCVYHNRYGVGNVCFDVGGTFRFNTEAENNYDFVHNDMSLSLVSQMDNGKFCTKYINLSEKNAVVKEVLDNPVDYEMTTEYICVSITVHLEKDSVPGGSEVISFAVKR